MLPVMFLVGVFFAFLDSTRHSYALAFAFSIEILVS
jgi:hypothetical protein